MSERAIRIDETKFTLPSGSPFEFTGVHAGRELSGIDLNITAYSDVEAQEIEGLLKKDTVEVEDPFADRQYKATLNRRSSGSQDGRPEKWYRLEVKELDEAPRFTELEIEGHCFHVLRNTEKQHKDVIGIYVLLRLSPEEFLEFHRLRKLDSIKFRRLGIDESPIVHRWGGALYWSSHQEGSKKYYKQIVRLFPASPRPERVVIASGLQQMAESRMIVELSARYEALVRMLVKNGQISQHGGEELMSREWQGLVDDDRRVILHSKLTEVDDAELELD